MKPFNPFAITKIRLAICAIGLLCIDPGMVMPRADAGVRPGTDGLPQSALPGPVGVPSPSGRVSMNNEAARHAQQKTQVQDEKSRGPAPQRGRSGSAQGYHMWLGKCWKGGGTIAMAFPPQSVLPSYFNPFWTRASMRFCADTTQPVLQ